MKRLSPSNARFRRRQWIRADRRRGWDVTVVERPGRAPLFVAAVRTELWLACAEASETETVHGDS